VSDWHDYPGIRRAIGRAVKFNFYGYATPAVIALDKALGHAYVFYRNHILGRKI
jgi:hypothetical protein